MPRLLDQEIGGLRLLDQLYRYQLIVHLPSQYEQREWLLKIGQEVREAVEAESAAVLDGSQSKKDFHPFQVEFLIHSVLCRVELLIAASQNPDKEPYFPAVVHALDAGMASKKYGISVDKAQDLALHLAKKYNSPDRRDFYRLAERAFAAENPAATINVYAWLMKIGLFRGGRFRESKIAEVQPHELSTLAYRASLLLSLDSARFWFRRSNGANGKQIADYVKLGKTPESKLFKAFVEQLLIKTNLTEATVLSLMKQAETGLMLDDGVRDKILSLNYRYWYEDDRVEVIKRFARVPSLTTSRAGLLQSKAHALGRIAAALIRIAENSRQTKSKASVRSEWSRFIQDDSFADLPLFFHETLNPGDESRCKAGQLKARLEGRGFTISARTVFDNRATVLKHEKQLEKSWQCLLHELPLPEVQDAVIGELNN